MADPDSSNGERYSVKELTQKMLEGENEFVMKYLKTLPKDECKETRARLIKNLEEIQKKKKNGTVGRSGTRKKDESPNAVPTSQPLSVASTPVSHGSVGKSSGSSSASGTGRRKPKHRKHIETNEKETMLDEEIDKGPFGIIYRASHTDTNSIVCVKQIEKDMVDKDRLSAVTKETELLLTFNHANIVKCSELVDSKKFIYLVYENITRGSLLRLIQTYGNFPESLCAICISQVLEALNYLHSKGFRHDDIRCNNMMITNLGFVKLSGFGNIRREDLGKDSHPQLEPFWMSPEEVADNGTVGLSSDIWSLGCSIIEMLSGDAPYSSLSNSQALNKIANDDHPPLPTGISPELTKFFLASFVKDSKRRSTTQNLLVHPWMKLHESARKENNTYSEVVTIIRKANPNKKVREDDLELQLKELSLERDILKMQNQELKDKISQAQQAKKNYK